MAKCLIPLLLVYLISNVQCANVLYLNSVASPSHHIFNRALAIAVAKNHNVTFVSVDVSKAKVENLHYIELEKTYEILYGGDNAGEEGFDLLGLAEETPFSAFGGFYDFLEKNCKGVLASKGLDVILNYPNDFKFDLVIHDFTCGPCILPLLHKFNYPKLIAVTAFAIPPYAMIPMGGHKYPAYVSHYLVTGFDESSFFSRFYNTLLYTWDIFSFRYIGLPRLEKIVQERFKFKDMPSLAELEEKTLLMFVNVNSALDAPEPIQPNMIPVGGLQIAPAKPLSQEMENFINSGKKGTILMSLGTNMKSNLLGDKILTNILKTFAALPDYNFLWKFESEPHELPIKPTKNVMLGKFLPQNDILAHPKIVGFVSHCGLLSTHESIYHGKPIIGMPFFADQHRSIHKSMDLGIATKTNFRDLYTTETKFKEAILAAVENPKIIENSKKISKLFREKPQTPTEIATWWVDFVIRTENLDHLKSPTLKLGFFASNLYDVLLVLVLLVHVLIYLVVKIVKAVMSLGKPKRKTD